ncbi:hypothetical protein DSL72_001874 [Monilinia vaccinii-corymbosi]|uniref:Uncharacterized protein n=1 Tax=Monilinia vaccinii-corymbosi TaxID=61207 RepID=A0A8A3PB20_9HELO|nr:hypothetical protein DSL72_001874 [Monilinia vaccinii-corymbosi]
MKYRISCLLWPAVSWAAVIPAPIAPNRGDESNEIKQPIPISPSSSSSSSSSSSQSLEIRGYRDYRDYREYHADSFHHTKHDSHEPHSRPHIPTSWKVAFGVDAFVLLITALILCMLVCILRKEYKKRNLHPGDPAYVGAKDGFGRRMKSARSGRSARARAWSYDPIREEEEGGEAAGMGMGMGMEMEMGGAEDVRLGGLVLGPRDAEDEMSSVAMAMRDHPLAPAGSENENGEGARKGKGTKAKRAWKGKHVRFSSWGGETARRDSSGVVAGSSGKEHGGAVALRLAEAHEYVQTP